MTDLARLAAGVVRKQLEYGKGPNGQPIVVGIREWIETPADRSEELAAATAELTRAIEGQDAAQARRDRKVAAAAASAATGPALEAFIAALPEPVEGLTAIDYWRSLRALEVTERPGGGWLVMAPNSAKTTRRSA